MIKTTSGELGAVARFGIVGAAATAVHVSVLAALVEGLRLWPSGSNLLAFLVAVGVSYFGHRNFSFRSNRGHAAGLPIFAAIAGAGAAANFAIFVLFNDLLGVPWGWTFLITLGAVTPFTYLLSRNLAFTEGDADSSFEPRLWLAPALFFAAAALMTVLLHHPLPYFDHWDLVPLYDAASRGELRLADLFRPHGGHWHATGYMVMLVLARLTHMSHLAEVCASLAIALGGGVVLVRLCAERAAALDLKRTGIWAAAILSFFWFSLDQAPNWLWGWQVAVFLNTTGALIAIVALSRPVLRLSDVAVAAAASAAAFYAFATGLALLPLGLLLIMARPQAGRGRWMAASLWLAFSAAAVIHYQIAVLAPADAYIASATPKRLDAAALVDLTLFTLTFVGGAIGRFSDGVSLPMTVLGAVAGGTAIRVLARARPEGWRVGAPFIALSLYGLGSGLLTAYGRIGLGVEQALISRYISFANFYWIGVIGLVLLAIGLTSSPRLRRTLQVFVGLVLVLKVATIANVTIDKNVVEDHARLVVAAEQIRAAYPAPAPEALAAVSAPEQTVQARVAMLARERLSLFRD